MRWYSRLYVGEHAKKKRFSIIQRIRHGKLLTGAYVITPASNGKNILDIYPAGQLLAPPVKDRDLLIVGIAADYLEALLVAGRIVDEMYRNTGGFDLEEFLKRKA